MTTLLCLLVISLESLISSFQFVPPSLTKEWVITQAWTGLSVCGIQGSGIHKVPVFSLSEEEGLTDNCLGIAFVNKTWVLGFSFLVSPSCWCLPAKGLVGKPWEQRWHQSQPGFPSNGSRSQLRWPVSGWWDTTEGDAVKRHMHPSFMKLIRCFCWLVSGALPSHSEASTNKVRGGGTRNIYSSGDPADWMNPVRTGRMVLVLEFIKSHITEFLDGTEPQFEPWFISYGASPSLDPNKDCNWKLVFHLCPLKAMKRHLMSQNPSSL